MFPDSTNIDNSIPFDYTMQIYFTVSTAVVNLVALDACTLPYTTVCSNSTCGSSCTNGTGTLIHHKNIAKNLARVRDNITLSPYDLMLTLITAGVCMVGSNGVHGTGVMGVAYRNGAYVMTNNKTSYTEKLRVRIIQHEFSHCFGCHDGVCPSGELCIMKGSYDTASLYTYDIWCSVCQSDFNWLAH